jgi:hypothetical protein
VSGTGRIGWALAAVIGGPLVVLYLGLLSLAAFKGALVPTSELAAAIAVAQILKLILVFSWKRLRDGNMILAFDVFSAEMLLLPFLEGAFFLTGDKYYIQLTGALFFSWPTAALLSFPVYSLYRFVVSLVRGGKASSVLLSGTAQLGILVTLLSVVSSVSPDQGLQGLPRQFGALITGQASAGSTLGAFDSVVTAATVMVYLGLLFYATSWRDGSWNAGFPRVLALSLLGTILTLLWSLGSGEISRSSLIVFTAPTSIGIAALWWLGREK